MKKFIKRLIIFLALLFVLSFLTAVYLIQMTGVIGSSMEPTLEGGQKILVNKFVYNFKRPRRFDVVVFRYLYEHDQYYVKRLIGLPGETVQINDGFVYINGKKLSDLSGVELIRAPGRASKPVVLGEDEYFVLGDNRNFSSDSRKPDVGSVKREQILGKAVIKLWPPEWIH